jgi:hypothetical protein
VSMRETYEMMMTVVDRLMSFWMWIMNDTHFFLVRFNIRQINQSLLSYPSSHL